MADLGSSEGFCQSDSHYCSTVFMMSMVLRVQRAVAV